VTVGQPTKRRRASISVTEWRVENSRTRSLVGPLPCISIDLDEVVQLVVDGDTISAWSVRLFGVSSRIKCAFYKAIFVLFDTIEKTATLPILRKPFKYPSAWHSTAAYFLFD
jgi:hypothetical protein